jgi:hypothetical protein
MTNRLAALTKLIMELHLSGLEVCHCVKEFYIRWIHPLGRQKILAFKCPQMADPCHEPSEGCLSVLSPHC